MDDAMVMVVLMHTRILTPYKYEYLHHIKDPSAAFYPCQKGNYLIPVPQRSGASYFKLT